MYGMKMRLVLVLLVASPLLAGTQERRVTLEGEVVDAESGKALPCRLYVQGSNGRWHTVKSASRDGSAVPHIKERLGVSEVHTTLSAHPFLTDLEPGEYVVAAEPGKEYFPAEQSVKLENTPVKVTLKLRRWIDMAKRGWYSGDTHVHRGLDELPNVVLAEDLNVSFPLLYWVTRAHVAPTRGDKSATGEAPARVISVDSTHVIWPRNTEYEIFTVDEKRHELGAFFVLGHRSKFNSGVPPVQWAAKQAHSEGGLIELDKHVWPWSMCIIPVMDVDLYELANNHMWRAGFGFRDWGEPPPPYMKIERDDKGLTEWGWIDYGFKNYYALLNSGFRLRPTAGTASGVHPVPLGFGRVYVKLDGEFSYDAWLRGLDEGRSFVTTGPMLLVEAGGKPPGHTFQSRETDQIPVTITAVSETPLERIELVVNGAIQETYTPQNNRTARGAYESTIAEQVRAGASSSWVAARAIEKRPGGRVRFAHSSPIYIDIQGRPIRPRKEEVDFLIGRVRAQISRSQGVVAPRAIAEYQKALTVYRDIAKHAER